MNTQQAYISQNYRLNVGIMLLNARQQVFVARRLNMSIEAWQMPQGGIDDGETPLDAAMRELKEEIGTNNVELIAETKDWRCYDLPHELVGKIWQGRWRGQCQKWFIMRFMGNDEDINLATREPEFDAWKWVSIEHLPELIVSFKRQVYIDVIAEASIILRQEFTDFLSDPIVRAAMDADRVGEEALNSLLRRVAAALRCRDRPD